MFQENYLSSAALLSESCPFPLEGHGAGDGKGGIVNRALEVKCLSAVDTYSCEVEPDEFAVTNSGYLSTLQPEITQ